MRYKISAVILVIISLLFCGCSHNDMNDMIKGSNNKQDNVNQNIIIPDEAVLGMFFSMEEMGTTIQWFDEALNPVSCSEIDALNTGAIVGYQNAAYYKGSAILVSQGEDSDDSNVVIIEKDSKDIKEYRLGRINPTSWSVSGDSIALASNYNWESFIDVIDLNSGDSKSIQPPDTLFAYTICLGDGVVYGIAENLNEDHNYCIASYDIDGNKSEKLFDLPDEEPPSFIQYASGKIYTISGGKLLIYDTNRETAESIELPRKDGFNISISGEHIWIGYTDIHDEHSESLIECRELSSFKILCSAELEGSIWQIDPSGSEVYVLGESSIEQFVIEDGELKAGKRAVCEDYEKCLGGFFRL